MRMIRRTGLVLGSVLLAGCYTLQPASGVTPQIGDDLAFDINDVGRAALGGTMGPEIGQVEGRENAEFLVAVSAVHTLRSGDQVWKGEQVRIKSEYVGSTYQRHFSKGRTLTISVVGIAALAFIVSRSVLGSGSEDPINPPPGGDSIRVP
jgi:hypothetical protein